MDTLVKPTVAPVAVNSGRSVYRPAGAPKVVQKPKQVNVGGFGTQQSNKRQLGTSFEQAPKAEVDNRIEKVVIISSNLPFIFIFSNLLCSNNK